MKIVFVCGSIERGCDGVGDYTRRLAQALLTIGHDVSIIAMRDAYVNEQKREIIESETGEIKILRIPQNISLKESSFLIKSELDEIKPDWVSLQFVIFAYHAKGLPFGLGQLLSNSFKGYKVHVMFHELWLGMEKVNNLKHSLWGFFQKRIVLSMISQLKPSLIHTNSRWYADQLGKVTNKVKVLPLFSNIPVQAEFENKNRSIDFLNHKSIKFVVFGHISLHAPVEKFVQELNLISEKNNIDVSITFIGKNNSDLNRWIEAWKIHFQTIVLGIQSEYEISKTLSQSDIGISTTPYALLGKSGSFYALLDHGLPVINVSDLNELFDERKNFKAPHGLLEYRTGNLEEVFSNLILPEKTKQLDTSRDLFLNDLINVTR